MSKTECELTLHVRSCHLAALLHELVAIGQREGYIHVRDLA